jgi:quinol monooxygenase YgiN
LATEVVQLDFRVVPMRAERFVEAYRPAVLLAVEFGVKGYSFYRNDEDPSHFVHISYWEEREQFNRYWTSLAMREIRTQLVGLHDHLLLPHHGAVLERA